MGRALRSAHGRDWRDSRPLPGRPGRRFAARVDWARPGVILSAACRQAPLKGMHPTPKLPLFVCIALVALLASAAGEGTEHMTADSLKSALSRADGKAPP